MDMARSHEIFPSTRLIYIPLYIAHHDACLLDDRVIDATLLVKHFSLESVCILSLNPIESGSIYRS
jgi:hypothetical protein